MKEYLTIHDDQGIYQFIKTNGNYNFLLLKKILYL